MIDAILREILHEPNPGQFMVRYELLDNAIAEFPDDGRSVEREVVDKIRERLCIDVTVAYRIWKDRDIVV